MRILDGEQVLMRIFVGEADRHGRRPLYRALVQMLRREGIAGATVTRGVLGFGAMSQLHTTNLLRLSADLPMVIEVVDSQDQLDRVLPIIDEMVDEGFVTLEKVRVLRYGPRNGVGSTP